MRPKKILLILIFTTSSLWASSQELSRIERIEMGGFVKEGIIDVFSASLLPSFNPAVENSKENEHLRTGNNVFIRQIGSTNNVNSNISSSDAVVNLEQYGTANVINVDLEAKRIRYDLVQNGDNNNFSDFAIDPTGEIFLDLRQEGNNNNLERFGTNTIGNKLEFQMTGNKTIIVRNFQ